MSMARPEFDLNELARRIQQNARETDIMKVASEIHFRTRIPPTIGRIHASISARNNGVVSPKEIKQILQKYKLITGRDL